MHLKWHLCFLEEGVAEQHRIAQIILSKVKVLAALNCRMMEEVSDNKESLTNLLTLPTELLVYIFMFLPTARDKVKMKYVSRRLWSVIEAPSLWSEFVWPYYDSREECCVNNFFKLCGGYMKTVSFPDYVPPPLELVNMLDWCSNVVELSLPNSNLDTEQLAKATEHMRRLQKLEVQWGKQLIPLLSIGTNLKVLTIRIKEKFRFSCFKSDNHLELFLRDWINGGLTPPNVNIYCIQTELEKSMLKGWLQWNHNSPPGHAGYMTLYNNWKAPVNLFPNLPSFQLQFGKVATLPLLNPSKFGVVGLENDFLLLPGNCGNVTAAATTYKARLWKHHMNIELKSGVSSLNMITEFDFSFSNLLQSNHLEQLAVVCPNLQRLNLQDHFSCLRSLQGLRTIANYCHSLQGLNLIGVQVTEVQNHIQLWEILSTMKLTHLAIELCIIIPFENDDLHKQNFIRLYQKCSHLRALQLKRDKIVRVCPKCEDYDDKHCLLLSHFPSLTLCLLENMPFQSAATMHNTVTSCKELKYLKYSMYYSEHAINLVPFLGKLQQLLIDCSSFDIPDEFMHMVSVHSELVHVLLYVKSVTHEGITTLIMNSPKLLTFYVVVSSKEVVPRINDAKAMELFYWKKFPNRKLFTAGMFRISQSRSYYGHRLFVFYSVKLNTDIIPLWN